MAYVSSVGGSASGANSTAIERGARRSGMALVAWSLRRADRREAARASRAADPRKAAGILDVSAPEAVRKFGFTPGGFR